MFANSAAGALHSYCVLNNSMAQYLYLKWATLPQQILVSGNFE